MAEDKQIKDLFERVKSAELGPSPYLKTRVLARMSEPAQKGFNFWKALSFASLAAVFILGFVSLQLLRQQRKSDGITQQAYVIHIDFNQSDKNMVAQAEVELPEHVHFVSSNKDIRDERTLTLPVDVKVLGRGKLPFVVASDVSGEKSIRVRLLNEKNELVREQVLKLTFAKQGESVVF